MFAKLSALLLALPLVSALTLSTPTDVTNAQTLTVTWTATTTDPAYFTLELVNPSFHDTYAISNNVQTALGTLTIELPQVPPEGGYQLAAIAINNVNDVLDQSGTFDIASGTSSSGTLTTPSTSATSLTPSVSLSTTPAVTTPFSSFTPLSSSTSSTASSASPSTFSSGAAAFKFAGVAPAGAAVLAVVAGAAMVF